MAVVSGDATIAPSAARERRAWRAGVRPQARWLVPAGLAAALLALLADAEPAEVARQLGLTAIEGDVHAATTHALDRLVVGTLGLGGLVVLVVVIAALVSGRLGVVSSAERQRLSARPVTSSAVSSLVPAVLALFAVLAGLRGVVAGAARAPAASEAGLFALYGGAASRALAVVAAALVVASVVEIAMSRRAVRRALFQTEAEARAEARSGGGRRG